MTHNIITYFHKYDWLCHLATFYNRYEKRWPSDKANVLFKELKIFDKVRNFLASADIKPFGCACLFAVLLLIGLALFYTLSVFV